MFDRLTGNQMAKDVLQRMLAQQRVPGAMIFAGEEGTGKKLFATELAKVLNCHNAPPGAAEACDTCSACVRIGRFAYPPQSDAEANKSIIWSEHRDVGLIHAPGRFILVPQIRDIERETHFRPYEGRRRIFIIDDADKLNDASANALLKTLEEIPATSHMILVTSRSASLKPTIRSRCQTVRFTPLTTGQIEQHLTEAGRRAGADATLAAQLARGSLRRALEFNVDDYRAQRDWTFAVLSALTPPIDRARLLRAAEEITEAKHKDEYEPRLDVMETLVHDVWRLSLGNPGGSGAAVSIVNEDIRQRLVDGISTKIRSHQAAAWLQRIEELRTQLAVNINRKVATDNLFLAMGSSG